MDRKEFMYKVQSLNEEIDLKLDQINSAKAEYLEKNKKFPIGSKVRVITPERRRSAYSDTGLRIIAPVPEVVRVGIVRDYEISHDYNVVPIVNEISSKGVIYNTNMVIHSFDLIELAE